MIERQNIADVYEWWGRHPILYRVMRWLVTLGREHRVQQQAIAALHVKPGATVLDLACGTGANFPWIESVIGPTGTLVAVDVTPAMLEAAQIRAVQQGWHNVHLLLGDAATIDYDAVQLDAAICTYALSVIPDIEEALVRVKRAMRPGARFVVVDAVLFTGVWRILNPLIILLFRTSTSWNYRRDIPAIMRTGFGDVVVHRYHGGSLLFAVAIREAVELDGTGAGDVHHG